MINGSVYLCVVGILLGIDFGLKRTGIAVTDSLMIIASPLLMVPSEDLMTWIKAYHLKNKLTAMVLGFPLSVDGTYTHLTENVLLLKSALEKEFVDVPVYLQDERHSSQRASQAIHQLGKKKHGKDKGIVDKVSAAIILQDYLNERET
jgi:putative Holliday junction resolvase